MDNETLLSLLADIHSPANSRPPQTEGELRTAIVAHLRTQGWKVVEQVPCTVGTADLVARRDDRTTIVETKLALTRRSIFEAAGQVLAYKAAIDPDADTIAMGYARHLPTATVAAVAALDVTVIAWDQQVEEQRPNARPPTCQPASSFPSPPLECSDTRAFTRDHDCLAAHYGCQAS